MIEEISPLYVRSQFCLNFVQQLKCLLLCCFIYFCQIRFISSWNQNLYIQVILCILSGSHCISIRGGRDFSTVCLAESTCQKNDRISVHQCISIFTYMNRGLMNYLILSVSFWKKKKKMLSQLRNLKRKKILNVNTLKIALSVSISLIYVAV